MIPVTFDGHNLYVYAGSRDTSVMQMVPGARYDSQRQAWKVFGGLSQVWALGGLFGSELERSPDVDRLLNRLTEFTSRQQAVRDLKVIPEPMWYGFSYAKSAGAPKLYEFQAADTEFLAHGKRVLMASEMGVGKTPITLTALARLRLHRTLIVCTKSMMHKWAAEARIWFPDAESFVVEGTAPKRAAIIDSARLCDKQAVVIINYEALRLHTKLAGFGSTRIQGEDAREKELNLIRWDAVVADEAHKAKDPRSKQTRALWGVSKEATYRFALTGTPLVNSPDDLWSIMHFVCPEEWPTRSQFRERYCIVYANPHGGYENLGLKRDTEPELRRFLDPRMLRRTKAEVLHQLPPKTYDVRFLGMDPKQAKVYRELAERMIAEIDEGLLVVTDPLVLSGRLRQAASAVPELQDGEVVGLKKPSNKVDALLDLVEEMGGAPLVVFSESRKLLELAATHLPSEVRVGMITGKVSGAERQQNVALFQDGKLDIMLCTTGAGAEGITLTRADTLCFLQQSWSNVANKQAEDRIHRIGQEGNARIITYLTEDTIEEAVYAVLAHKDELLQEVVRDPYWIKEAIWGRRK
jgi:SNF2 family DNA or RNA helicase